MQPLFRSPLSNGDDASGQGFALNDFIAVDLQAANDVPEGCFGTQSLHIGHLRSEGQTLLVTGEDGELTSSASRGQRKIVRHIASEAINHANAAITQRRRAVTSDGSIFQIRLFNQTGHLGRNEHPAIRLIVISARPCESPDVETPGQITVAEGERLIVNTGQGGLELLTLRPEGKGDMAAAEFLHGHPVDAESQLTSAPAGD